MSTLLLPALGAKVRGARLLATGRPVTFSEHDFGAGPPRAGRRRSIRSTRSSRSIWIAKRATAMVHELKRAQSARRSSPGLALPLAAQHGAPGGEWRSHGGDPASTKCAPLGQITKANVSQLRIAWRRPAVDPSLVRDMPELLLLPRFPCHAADGRWCPVQLERRRTRRGVQSRHRGDVVGAAAVFR